MDRPLDGRRDGQQFVVSHTEEGAKQRGYPTTEVTWGPRTLDELTGVLNPLDVVVSRKKTGKATVDVVLANGVITCVLHQTVIARIAPSGAFWLNTGGWNTVTTYRHMEKFMGRHGFNIKVGGYKETGGNIVRWFREAYDGEKWPGVKEAAFLKAMIFYPDGKFHSDHTATISPEG